MRKRFGVVYFLHLSQRCFTLLPHRDGLNKIATVALQYPTESSVVAEKNDKAEKFCRKWEDTRAYRQAHKIGICSEMVSPMW